MMRHTLRHLLLCFCLCLAAGSAHAQLELNVKVRQGNADLIQLLHQKQGAVSPQDFPTQRSTWPFLSRLRHIQPLVTDRGRNLPSEVQSIFTLRFDPSVSRSFLTELMQGGWFEFVEENRSIRIEAVPPVTEPDLDSQWYHAFIRTFESWDTTRGSASVVIGILDTGLDFEHPEFDGQVAVNAAEDANGNGRFEHWPFTELRDGISGDLDGVDADNNGYTDDVAGYDFTDQPRSPFGGDYLFEDGNPQDENSHGTLVAGIAAARSDNSFGGSGIAPGCKLKVLRAFSANGTGEDDDISRAIVYAADNGIRILNLSFGDVYPSLMMHEAVRYAAGRGVVMIASAGNGTGDNVHYPSGWSEVISVSASTLSSDSLSEYLWPLSSYGPTVSLAAPGNNIYAPIVVDTTSDEPPFDYFGGTSTAAPMVSAAVGLLFSQRGICSPQQVRGLLVTSADDIGEEGWDHFTGAGRLNIQRLLQNPAASNVQILTPENDAAAQGLTAVLGTVFDPRLDSWSLTYKAGISPADAWTVLSSGQTQQMQDTLGFFDATGLPEGEYTLRLVVGRTDGSTQEDRIRLLVDRSAPQVEIKVAQPAWDNNERKLLIVYRSDDAGTGRLHYRALGASAWQVMTHDRLTRNGEFLPGMQQLSDGDYEYFVEVTNAGGLTGQSATDTISFAMDFISLSGVDTTGMALPMGYYVNQLFDLDNDGLKEVFLSEYDDQLSFGRLKWIEANAGEFADVDSSTLKPVLIPKDLADTDGDGLIELLSSVNDSIFITEQAAAGSFPSVMLYSLLGQGRYASEFAQADADPEQELLLKDFEDYFVLNGAGSSWTQSATLIDNSGSYEGSVAPRTLSGDFDGDGKQEIVFGDYDGDILVYENQGGNSFARTFVDSTQLEKSGSYLVQGNFDADAAPEIFVAVHSSLLRNDDFEYDPSYWVLRIFDAVADNTWQVIWTDYLYDLDTESFNAATAGNVDTDAEDEILFTTFPRTYLIDMTGGSPHMDWFHYGDLCTHHLIGDFNGNGVNEFALGNGLEAPLYEKDFNYTGPMPTAWLSGEVSGPSTVNLNWEASANATAYRIWRGPYVPGNTLISLIDSTAALSFSDAGLATGTDYLYVIESKNAGLNPSLSDFSNAVLLRPHSICQVLGATAVNARQLRVTFSEVVNAAANEAGAFVVNGNETAVSVISTGDEGRALLLSFANDFVVGGNVLAVDSAFRDALSGPLDPASLIQPFNWIPDSGTFAFLTHWDEVSDRSANLFFNLPMDTSVLNPMHFAMHPTGLVLSSTWANASHTGVTLEVDRAAFGALGYPLTITVTQVQAEDGSPITDKEGNVATFSRFSDDLSQVFVYPNPVKPHQVFNGVRFANLTREARIAVLNVNGRLVRMLHESDGDGGIEWDLTDEEGKRIKPGTYIFKVSAEGLDSFLGKLILLE